jgi:hypothetical protein
LCITFGLFGKQTKERKEEKSMKKRIVSLLLVGVMALSLVACGDNGEKVESEKEVVTEETTTEETEETEEPADDSTTGEIVEENGLRKEPVITDKELNKAGETGPFKYSINAIQVSKVTATNDDMALMLEIEKDKEVTLVVMDVTVENTTEDTNSFYFDQSKLTSNTKEQVYCNFWLSDAIGGEFLGNVVQEGSIYFILPNTNADDLTDITLHVDAPHDADYNSIGDDVKVELSFK